MIYYYGKVSVPRKEILMEKEDVATNNEKEDDASETQDVDLKDENGLDEEEKKVVDKAKELDGEVSKKQKKNNKKKIIIIVIIISLMEKIIKKSKYLMKRKSISLLIEWKVMIYLTLIYIFYNLRMLKRMRFIVLYL